MSLDVTSALRNCSLADLVGMSVCLTRSAFTTATIQSPPRPTRMGNRDCDCDHAPMRDRMPMRPFPNDSHVRLCLSGPAYTQAGLLIPSGCRWLEVLAFLAQSALRMVRSTNPPLLCTAEAAKASVVPRTRQRQRAFLGEIWRLDCLKQPPNQPACTATSL